MITRLAPSAPFICGTPVLAADAETIRKGTVY